MLNGEKLWCTNGTLAELLVVMARDPKTQEDQRLRRRDRLARREGRVPLPLHGPEGARQRRRQLPATCACRARTSIGEEGKGLKIALITLNTGRLTLPAACAGIAKQCLEIVPRLVGNARVQWGVPIWKHEAIAHQIADMAATTFAMDSVCASSRARWPTAAATTSASRPRPPRSGTPSAPGRSSTSTLQIRGGRGYETERSLHGRGETPIPVERMMRDCRINLIFEGSSEIMHLFMAREAVDKHLQVAGAMIDPKNGTSARSCRRCRRSSASTPAGTRRCGCAGSATPVRYGDLGHARDASALRRAQLPQARARELPRHGGLPGEDGAQAGLPLPLRRRRHGAVRDVGGDRRTRASMRDDERSRGRARRGARRPLLPERRAAR